MIYKIISIIFGLSFVAALILGIAIDMNTPTTTNHKLRSIDTVDVPVYHKVKVTPLRPSKRVKYHRELDGTARIRIH